MEKPIHLSTVLYELLVSKLGDNPKAREILENPSQYLLHECEIFDTPELLLYVVFDMDGVEYLFTKESVEALKKEETKIPIKRLIDHKVHEIDINIIKDSFDKGCVIDYIKWK